jgi:molybdenum cofactor cytidylyltransferase
MSVEEAGSHWGVGAVVLAAGSSARMGGANKLIEPVDGVPVVVHVVGAAVAAGAAPVVVVTGHDADAVRAALAGTAAELIHNPRWRDGMSTSLAAGISALEGRVRGALICLGDMPRVRASDLRALIHALDEAGPDQAAAAYVPLFGGQWGNPVLWTAPWFPELRALRGDRGARGLLQRLGPQMVLVPASEGVLLDADTPDALERLRAGPATKTSTTRQGEEHP